MEQIADAIDASLKDKAKSPEELDAPKKLRDIGVPETDLERIADKLLTFKRLLDKNPRPVLKEGCA